MKKHFTLAVFTALVIVVITTYSFNLKSNIAQPPGAYAGNPGTQTCVHCHGTTSTTDASKFSFRMAADTAALSNAANEVTASTQYTPDADQWISLKSLGTNGANTVYGFQIVALTASNTMAGAFTVTNSANTLVQTVASKQYIGHKNANSGNSWSFKWRAPHSGNVTFYYVTNVANGNGSDDIGDLVYQNSVTISAGPFAGIGDIEEKIGAMSMYPNPFNSTVNMELEIKETGPLSMMMIPMDGTESKELFNGKIAAGKFNRIFDISDVPAGVYLVKIQMGDASTIRRIVKL